MHFFNECITSYLVLSIFRDSWGSVKTEGGLYKSLFIWHFTTLVKYLAALRIKVQYMAYSWFLQAVENLKDHVLLSPVCASFQRSCSDLQWLQVQRRRIKCCQTQFKHINECPLTRIQIQVQDTSYFRSCLTISIIFL